MPSTSPAQLLKYQQELLAGQPTSVIVAVGPYTLDTDLLYEPLEALLESARTDRPDALILVGVENALHALAFADHHHPLSSDHSSTLPTHSSRSVMWMKRPTSSSEIRYRSA